MRARGVFRVQVLQCRKGFSGLVAKPLRHREQVQRLGTLLVSKPGVEKIPDDGHRLAKPRGLDQFPCMVKPLGGAIGARRRLCAAKRVCLHRPASGASTLRMIPPQWIPNDSLKG